MIGARHRDQVLGPAGRRCEELPGRLCRPEGILFRGDKQQRAVIIVSPYARPGNTDTTATTFAGILAYTEHTFGLSALGVNDSAAYSLADAFNYSQQPIKPVRMTHRPLPASAKRIHLTRALENDPT